MCKKYIKLRQEMMAQDVNQGALGEIIGRGAAYISTRMTGKAVFDMNDVYAIMNYLGLPHEKIAEYFPPLK